MHRHYSIKLFGLVLLLVLSFMSCKVDRQTSQVNAEDAILGIMKMQEEAWSEGSIDQFMEGYWKSEQLSFIGSSGIQKGWRTTLENYKKAYPSKEDMGRLTFEVIELNKLSPDSYHMIGRYTLERKMDKPTGLFTLIWRNIDGNWVIVSDHTSG